MRNYAPYLLYQIARFGALSVPQMLKICEGKCKRSSLYRTLSKLVEGDYVYPILNPASRTRAYYATMEGRRYVFGDHVALTSGVKTAELDHAIQCAEILLELCQYERVTGISTQYEMSMDEVKRFCHERVPDGIFQLTQDGHHFELALEVESSVRNSARINEVLARYWQTFKYGMPCSGLLIVAMSKSVFGMYAKAIQAMPMEFQTRVRLIQGPGLEELKTEVYGQKLGGLARCLDLTRTLSIGEIQYMPVKTEVFLAQTTPYTPQKPLLGQQ